MTRPQPNRGARHWRENREVAAAAMVAKLIGGFAAHFTRLGYFWPPGTTRIGVVHRKGQTKAAVLTVGVLTPDLDRLPCKNSELTLQTFTAGNRPKTF